MKKVMMILGLCLTFVLASCANPTNTNNPNKPNDTNNQIENEEKITSINGSYKMEIVQGNEKAVGIFTFDYPIFSLYQKNPTSTGETKSGYYKVNNESVFLYKDDGKSVPFSFVEGINSFKIINQGTKLTATDELHNVTFTFEKQ